VSGWTLVKSYLLWERLLCIVATTRNLFWNWIQKLLLYTSSYGVSNQQEPPQRELLRYWEYQCKWSTESFSSWNKQYLLLLLSGMSTLNIIVCWRDTQHKHCLYCHDSLNWVEQTVRHTTQVLHLLWLIIINFVKRQGLQKAGRANVLPKTTAHTMYKTTTCMRYNTASTKTCNDCIHEYNNEHKWLYIY